MTVNDTLQEWTKGPNTRGTFDIFWSCAIVIGLCCWTSVHGSIPAEREGFIEGIYDRLKLASMVMLGPDFTTYNAAGQWWSARTSVQKFQAASYQDWTMRHAFLADMGGFKLKAPDYPPIPLDAEQVFFLVEHRYIDFPKITIAEINDRNKADSTSRVITLFLALIFTITFVFRLIQHLAVTTLEITTTAFVVAMMVTSLLWFSKPSDVRTAVMLETSTTIEDIRDRAGLHKTDGWIYTPLDFVSRKTNWTNSHWIYYVNILRALLPHACQPKVRKPVDRLPSIQFWHYMPFSIKVGFGWFMGLYAAIFVGAWNMHFPSNFERTAWRVSSVGILVFGFVMGFLALFTEKFHFSTLKPETRPQSPDRESTCPTEPGARKRPKLLKSFKKAAARLRNNSPEGDPMLDIPLRYLIPTTIFCALYVFMRAYILVEDLVSLRLLPASAYMQVEWSLFLPHT